MFISLQYALERRERAEKTLFIGRELCYNKFDCSESGLMHKKIKPGYIYQEFF